MSPAFRAILGCYLKAWIFWAGAAYAGMMVLAVAMANFAREQQSAAALTTIGLLGTIWPAAIAFIWGQCADHPSLFLAPQHRRIHRAVAFGVLIPLSGFIIWVSLALGGLHPGSALAIALATMVLGAHIGCTGRVGVLRLIVLAVIYLVWNGLRDLNRWTPSDLAAIPVAILLYVLMWNLALGAWRPQPNRVNMKWAWSPRMNRLPFRRLTLNPSTLVLAWQHLAAWTPMASVLGLWACGLVLGFLPQVIYLLKGVNSVSVEANDTGSVFMLLMGTVASTLMNLPLLGAAQRETSWLTRGAMAIERLRTPSRQRIATVVILTLTARAGIFGIVAIGGVWMGRVSMVLAGHNEYTLSVPWYIWVICPLVWCSASAAIALLPTFVRNWQRWVFSSGIFAMFFISHFALLELTVQSDFNFMTFTVGFFGLLLLSVVLLVPLAWRRLANAELP